MARRNTPFRQKPIFRIPDGVVSLNLNKDIHEDVIRRHGQLVRWMKGQACPCATETSGSPLEGCDECENGTILLFPENLRVFNESAEHAGFIGRTRFGRAKSIERIEIVRRNDLTRFDFVKFFNDRSFRYEGARQPRSDELLSIDYTYDPTQAFKDCGKTYKGNGLIELPTLLCPVADGGSVPADIRKIDFVCNADTGQPFTVKAHTRNEVYIDITSSEPEVDDTLIVEGEFQQPFTLVIQSAKQARRPNKEYIIDSGDAEVTYPDHLHIGHGDLLTPLMARQTISQVITRTSEFTDKANVLEMVNLISVIDRDGNKFEPGKDVVRFGRNEIRWLTSGPAVGKKYSAMFSYIPTYRVFIDKPSSRKGENTRFPNKATLKLFDRLGPQNEVIGIGLPALP